MLTSPGLPSSSSSNLGSFGLVCILPCSSALLVQTLLRASQLAMGVSHPYLSSEESVSS